MADYIEPPKEESPLAHLDASETCINVQGLRRHFVLMVLLLVLTTLGWPEYEFSINPLLLVNLDMTVNVPGRCQC